MGFEVRPAGTLIDRAIAALRQGPLHTTAIARIVMGIQGSPPAAATAVFTLLGTDARFAVDREGVWTLVDAATPAGGIALGQEDWVVVDVETTGGAPGRGHRITEIAAVRVSGGEIGESYATLVNPERRIPSMITSLTGITDAMVRGAPRFPEVVEDLGEVMNGRVFVAHNAAFDWGFVNHEMERARGGRISGRQLCTVRLARKLLPELPSRSLDSLVHYFGLEIASRHRALDDALATARILLLLIDRLRDRGVEDWDGLQHLLGHRTKRARRRAFPTSMDSA